MSTRNYLSGSAKRQLKKQREIAKKKFASSCSIEKFILKKPTDEDVFPNQEISTELESSIIATSSKDNGDFVDKNKGDENSIFPENYENEMFSNEQTSTKIQMESNIIAACSKDNEDYDVDRNEDKEKSILLKENRNENVSFELDPALWDKEIDSKMVEYLLQNPPPQNTDLVSKTERIFGDVKRSLTVGQFYHTKKNGEQLPRKWLVLSASSKMLFCWVCKLLHANKSFRSQLIDGFCDWKHVSIRLKEHENSSSHKQAMMNLSLRLNASQRIDSSLVQQYEEETKYWISVLKRIVAVIKFLAVRGLPFFGDNETVGSLHNGNFLGCLEVIAEFDPFLSQHLERYGNPGKGNISYMSSTSINQFIDVMAKKLQKQIIDEILRAKYYSIIVDSTPDITHLDQLCFVLRYIVEDEPIERFLKFIPMHNHKSENLAQIILSTLHEAGIDILNCRGQSYDNASNMAGKYTGVQARIKNINPAADFVPCSAHSLNLVGVNAVESCSGAMQFFSFVQSLYNFFSSSTHRWQVLNEELKKCGDFFTLNCVTRWCADANAVKSLRKNYNSILFVLNKLSTDSEENVCTRAEAQVLLKKIQKFETALNIIMWDTLLQRLQKTSTELQKSSMTLSVVSSLYQSLIDFTQTVRDNFHIYENFAKDICINKDYEMSRKKIKPKSKDPHIKNCDAAELTPREEFQSSVYYAICDALISHLHLRKDPYDKLSEKFACLTGIKDKLAVREQALNLLEIYPQDLDNYFPDELEQFSSLVSNEGTILDMFKKLKSLELSETFPNVDSALRIFLTLPVSNCSGERSFSLLKRLKSPTRSNLIQEKLSSLASLCIEGSLTQNLDYSDIISDFANMKFRKKTELYFC